jgi:hypothetical protein
MNKPTLTNATTTAPSAPDACCDTVLLSTCCGQETKAACCGPEKAPKVCGCGGAEQSRHQPAKGGRRHD